MKKKIFIALALFAGALCLALGVAGCQADNQNAEKTPDGEHLHNFGELIPEKPATCSEEGFEAHYFCQECQTYFDVHKHEISPEELKTGFDPTVHNYGTLKKKVEPKCETSGRQAYYRCADCGKYFDESKTEKQFDELTIPARGHKYGQLVSQVNAECEVAGTKAHYLCVNCGKYFDDQKVEKQFNELNIPAKGHNYGELVPQADARCEVAGMKAYYHCEDCGKYFDDQKVEAEYENLIIPEKGHDLGEFILEKSATCTGEGLEAHYFCADCGTYFDAEKAKTTPENLKLNIDPNAHKWNADGKCEHCRKQRTAYEFSPDGTEIYMGEYPQSEVTKTGLKVTLGMQAGGLPSAENANGWTDYNYYISGSVQSYMWFKDVEYQENRYRGVYFTSYRPHYTTYGSSTGNSCQDDNGYNINTVYWFKFEPIVWRVLEQKDGTALLMSDIILDSREFYHSVEEREGAIYPNNYKESDIRAWLNDTFYNTAFGQQAKGAIQVSEVKNGAKSTGVSPNRYICPDTDDNVFLLSREEITDAAYGFDVNAKTDDPARRLKSTAYAKSQGAWKSIDSEYEDNGWWWLRSPFSDISSTACYIGGGGSVLDLSDVNNTSRGVVPALRIKL